MIQSSYFKQWNHLKIGRYGIISNEQTIYNRLKNIELNIF